MDATPIDEPRSATAVARRALALFGTIAVALGAERDQLAHWLRSAELWHELTPSELKFMTASPPSDKQTIDASWHAERLIVLLWALGVAEIPEADEQCDTSTFLGLLPPYADVNERNFVNTATLRSEAELFEKADAILGLHWEARDASINDREPRSPVSIGIIQERHHAINWIIGYDGLSWDEVTTDT